MRVAVRVAVKQITRTFFLLVLSGTSTAAIDVTGSGFAVFDATVTKILQDDSNYGGCLIYLNRNPRDFGLGCTATDAAVSLDCLATRATTTKSTAAQKFSGAQLGLVTGNAVRLTVVDTGGLPNGYCYAERLDNYNDVYSNIPR